MLVLFGGPLCECIIAFVRYICVGGTRIIVMSAHPSKLDVGVVKSNREVTDIVKLSQHPKALNRLSFTLKPTGITEEERRAQELLGEEPKKKTNTYVVSNYQKLVEALRVATGKAMSLEEASSA